MENQYTPTGESTAGTVHAEKPNFDKEKVAEFYKKGLPGIFKTIFKDPINGTYSLFTTPSETGFINSIFLIVTTTILFIILPYLMMGEFRDIAGGLGLAFKLGIMIALFMVLISLVSFGVKSISGKPVFKNELLTGALCGIPLSLLIIFLFVGSLFVNLNPLSLVMGYMQGGGAGGIFTALVSLYAFLMMINILQQSLRAGGIKEVLAWYIAPASILVTFYLTQRLAMVFFMP
jgi:hypothetical protein